MIKNSIELAQILSAICLEPYPATYYKIAQSLYDCFAAYKTLYIYSSRARAGLGINFERKFRNSQPELQNKPSISVCFTPDQLKYIEEGDVILLLDYNEQIINTYQNTIISINETDIEIKAGEQFSRRTYQIPTKNYDRATEIQTLLLNSLTEELLKHLK